ncbi:MAG: aldose 1-epimerase family protein [Clostridia bacterium]|nr:aldose 1-epimerase family protein [Clostridia bacterium]
MIYSIENEILSVSADTKGGELASVKRKDTGIEYLWQGDAAYWTGRAYNLFPICGRLTEGKYTYRGQTYEMGSHGFVRNSQMTLVEQTERSMTFRLTDSAETMAQYPFSFVFDVTYTLVENKLIHRFTVKNTGDDELLFTLGGHPGFNLPLGDDVPFEDWYLEFDAPCKPEYIVFSAACLCDGYAPYALKDDCVMPLRHDLFDNDAIFLKDTAKGVTLKSDRSTHGVHVAYPDMTHVGVWHKPKTDAPYVCIEPWYGVPSDDGVIDDFSTKRGMLRLLPGETYSTDMEIILF